MKKNLLFVLAAVLLTLSSCHKDSEIDETQETTTQITQVTLFEETDADVQGFVFDEDGNPISGVVINSLRNSAVTDQYGVFTIPAATLDRQGSYFTATKDGYILGSDFVYPAGEGNVVVRIQMLRLSDTGSFSGASGGTINVEGGGKIVFDANTIADQNGNAYTGTVNVTAKRLAADDPQLGDKMPGDLRATDKEGRTVVLGTAGMVAVELRGDSGQELNLQDGATAEITFPIADSQLATVADEIPLWSFDEGKGTWVEEGTASRVGDNYVGEVSHFSFWNCDAPFPLIHLCGKVVWSDGSPATNIFIKIDAGNYGVRYGYVNENGEFCGKVPKNVQLTATICAPGCEDPLVEVVLGNFGNDVTVDDIVIPLTNSFFSGAVECNGVAVPNANVLVEVDGIPYAISTDENGEFVFNNLVLFCNNITEIEIFAYNPLTGEASPTEVITDFSAPVVLNTCNSCDFSIDIDTFFTNPCVNLPTYTVDVDLTTGDYTYEWSNGIQSDSLVVTQEGTYCITVTETNSGCSQIACISVDSLVQFDVFAEYSSTSCGLANGELWLYFTNTPTSFVVNGPNGFTSSDLELSGLEAGIYTVAATFAGGCTISKDFEIEDVPLEAWIQQGFEDCQAVVLYAGTNQGSGQLATYNWSDGSTGQEIFVSIPGTYCVTITETSGCSAETCIDVLDVEPLDFDPFNYGCSGPDFTFFTNNGGNVELQVWIQNDTTIFLDPFNPTVSVLDVGYNFQVLAYNQFCEEIFTVTFPYFQGFGDVTYDGTQFVFDGFDNTNCTNCTFEELQIFDINDLTENLMPQNGTTPFAEGQYVVAAVSDQGCWVNHVIIDVN